MNNLSPRGIEAINPTVRELMLNNKALEKLQDEADRGLWRENVSFLEMYLQFSKALTDQSVDIAKSLAKSIFTTFVRKDSAAQVNLDDEIVHQIESKLQGFLSNNDNASLFDEAVKQTSHMIYRDKAETLFKIKNWTNGGTASPSLSRASSADKLNNTTTNTTTTTSVAPTVTREAAQQTLKNMEENWIRGPLYYKKGTFSKWVLTTCVKKGKFLFQFKLGANHITQSPTLVIDLTNCKITKEVQTSSKPFNFLIISKNKTYEFRALNRDEYEVWVDVLSGTKKVVEPPRNSLCISSKPSSLDSNFSNSPSPSSSTHGSNENIATGSNSNTIEPTLNSPRLPRNKSYDSSSLYSAGTSIMMNSSDELQIILSCLESFTDPVVIGNGAGLIVAMNQAGLKMFGYTIDEVVNQEVSILMPEPFKSQHCAYIFRHEKFGAAKLLGKTRDLKAERKGGEVFDMQISLSKIKDHFMATIREKPNQQVEE